MMMAIMIMMMVMMTTMMMKTIIEPLRAILIPPEGEIWQVAINVDSWSSSYPIINRM